MLAETGSEKDLSRRDYWAQRKLDGTRIIIIRDGDRVEIRGHSWINDYSLRFPEIVEEIRKLPVDSCVLDGELTFFEKGTDRDVFITALASPETKKGYVAKAMVFDVIYVEDYDLRDLPLEDRLDILKDLIPEELKHVDPVRTVKKGKKAYFERISRKGGEGVIIKERKSPYREGERTEEWLKVKNWRSDEAVIVGFTKGKGERAKTFGSLILAQRDRDGKWRYVGKASGFTEEQMKQLLQKMRRLKLKTDRPPVKNPEKVDNVQAWVKPRIVVEVKYYEKSKNGVFRFPDFLRVRTDKKPEEVKLTGRS
jgi:bifunctional non-homologous end joining protein LigD